MNYEILKVNRRRLHTAWISLAALSATGWSQSTPKNEPTSSRNKPSASANKIAVVLGSGSARGFAHIGVIKALEEAGIKPHLIIGTSAGAIAGSMWAAGLNAEKMSLLTQNVKDIDIIDFASGSKTGGLISGEKIQNFLNYAIKNQRFDQLSTEFLAVTTELRTGQTRVINSGDVGFAVRASCSIPGVFLPAKAPDGVDLVDGGLVSPVPVKIARHLGADFVIAVDLNSAKLSAQPVGLFEQLMHSFDIMGRALSSAESDLADVVIRPNLSKVASTAFADRAAIIQLGYHEGQRMVDVIKEKIAQASKGSKKPASAKTLVG
jgi:NTE family protein